VPGKIKGTTYEVIGAVRLRRTLKGVEGGLEDLTQLHEEIGRIVADYARPRAPRVTGQLASTIRSSGTKSYAVVRAGFARTPYAGVQEFGWPARNIPPNPFLRPAAHITEPTWRSKYDDEVKRLLSKVKGA
jgi:hypothetical protein